MVSEIVKTLSTSIVSRRQERRTTECPALAVRSSGSSSHQKRVSEQGDNVTGAPEEEKLPRSSSTHSPFSDSPSPMAPLAVLTPLAPLPLAIADAPKSAETGEATKAFIEMKKQTAISAFSMRQNDDIIKQSQATTDGLVEMVRLMQIQQQQAALIQLLVNEQSSSSASSSVPVAPPAGSGAPPQASNYDHLLGGYDGHVPSLAPSGPRREVERTPLSEAHAQALHYVSKKLGKRMGQHITIAERIAKHKK